MESILHTSSLLHPSSARRDRHHALQKDCTLLHHLLALGYNAIVALSDGVVGATKSTQFSYAQKVVVGPARGDSPSPGATANPRPPQERLARRLLRHTCKPSTVTRHRAKGVASFTAFSAMRWLPDAD